MRQNPLGVQRLSCCGWREISALSGYQGDFNLALKSLCDSGTIDYYGINCGALLFTAAGVRAKYAALFAEAIKEKKLGKVIKLQTFKNPNTGRQIKPFMWIPDQKKLKAYCKRHKLFTRPDW